MAVVVELLAAVALLEEVWFVLSLLLLSEVELLLVEFPSVELVPLDVLFAELELLDELDEFDVVELDVVEFEEVVAFVALLVSGDAPSMIWLPSASSATLVTLMSLL